MAFEQRLELAKLKLGVTYDLKPQQREALQALYNKKDVVANLPTGFGKSIIYQLSPFVLSPPTGITLIVTPLNAIMQEQVLKLCRNNVKACYINMACTQGGTFELLSEPDANDLEADELEQVEAVSYVRETNVSISDLKKGDFNLIYAHPEALLSTSAGKQLMRSAVYRERVCCVAFDEAHMIHAWGGEFRKDFDRLQELLGLFPSVPAILLTGTVTPADKLKLIRDLGLRQPVCIDVHPDRPNIQYHKHERQPSTKTEDDLDKILLELATVLSEKRVNMPLTIFYTDLDVIRYCYRYMDEHLGMDQYEGEAHPDNRLFAQYHSHYPGDMKDHIVKELGKENAKIRLVFATVALGMGLDAPSVRKVIHFKPPTSIAKYLQETGRAGRDSLPATAVLYYNNTDIAKNRKVEKTMRDYCKSGDACLRGQLMEHLGYSAPDNRQLCSCCQVCQALCHCEVCTDI